MTPTMPSLTLTNPHNANEIMHFCPRLGLEAATSITWTTAIGVCTILMLYDA